MVKMMTLDQLSSGGVRSFDLCQVWVGPQWSSQRGDAKSVLTKSIEQWHFHEFKTCSILDAVSAQVQSDHLGRSNAAVTLPTLLSAHSSDLDGSGLATRLRCVSR
jgi:hypothetical protein